MDNNLNNPDPKKAIASPILGITSIILAEGIIAQGTGINYGSARLFLIGSLIAIVCAIFGLTIGIKGLKTAKKWVVILGIMFSLIGLYLSLGGLIGWLLVGGPLWL